MWPFKKKKDKKEEESIPAPIVIETPCDRGEHLWKDFPPYLHYDNLHVYDPVIEITEPYVCCLCHKRKNVILEKFQYNHNISHKNFMQEVDRVRDQYKDILKSKAVVEDMVEDHIHLDKLKLKYWEYLNLPKEDIDIEDEDSIPFL